MKNYFDEKARINNYIYIYISFHTVYFRIEFERYTNWNTLITVE